jgi:putative DNA primase/helicase
LWDGGTHTVDRRTSESFMVRNARLSMSLSIQPAAILAFLRKAGDIARGSGFLARFLIAWPESTQGFRDYEEPLEMWPALTAYNTRIRAILDMPLPYDETGNGLTPILLELSPEAKGAWIRFYNTIEHELKQDGELAMVRDVASKTADNAARIAGLFHLLQCGTIGQVNAEDMQAACSVAMWRLSESRRFLIGVSQSPELSLAVMLDEWLIKRAKAQKTEYFSTSHLLTHAPNKLRRKATLYPALDELVDSDRVKLFDDGKVRNVFINPKLLGVN